MRLRAIGDNHLNVNCKYFCAVANPAVGKCGIEATGSPIVILGQCIKCSSRIPADVADPRISFDHSAALGWNGGKTISAERIAELEAERASMAVMQRRRMAVLGSICEPCPEKSSEWTDKNGLRFIACRQLPPCCGGAPGFMNLAAGKCPIGKHDVTIESLGDDERARSM